MRNAVKQYLSDAEVFENALKVQNGSKTAARRQLGSKIMSFARIIQNDFNELAMQDNEIVSLQEINTTGGFGETEQIILLTETENTFGVNSKGEIYSFSAKSGNKYGFKRLLIAEILELPEVEIGYMHNVFCRAAKEVFKHRSKVLTP